MRPYLGLAGEGVADAPLLKGWFALDCEEGKGLFLVLRRKIIYCWVLMRKRVYSGEF